MLRLSPSARTFPAGPDCVYWATESKQGYCSSAHAGTLASLLADAASREALLERFPEGAARDLAAKTLDELIRRGLVESAADAPNIAQIFRESGIAPHLVKRNRWEKGASVQSVGTGASGDVLRQVLVAEGVPMSEAGGLPILAVTDYLDPHLENLHREWQRAGIPWALIKLAGEEIWIGPFFVPGRTACWRCLELRLRERAWLTSQLAPDAGPLWTPYESENRLRAAAECAAQEVARWLLEAPHSLEGAIWSSNWATLQSGRHTVARLPNCPDCGPGRPLQLPAFQLESVPLRWQPPADLRVEGPQALIDRLEPLASPITGILRRFERRDLVPSPTVFTYGAVYNVALPPVSLRIPGAILQPEVCSGRGWSADEAKAACLAEAVERYSLQFRGDEPRITSRFRDLADAAVDPNAVLLFSGRQFAQREQWNRTQPQEDAVPEPFDETEEIEWLQGRSLTTGRARFLPMALAAHYYRPPGRRWIGDAGSAGCAAGSSVEEAVLHSVLELVERDARAIWWFNRLARPAYSAQAIPDPLCRQACAQLERQGWEVRVIDITTDLRIPVFVALACREEGWIRAAGAHLHPAAALRQAVCELWQLSKAPPRTGSPPPYSTLDDGALQTGSCEECEVNLKTLVEECCEKIRQAGHETIVFDMTRPEIAFPVVRVVAPGLRPNQPRFAPGRLYDAPVRLGLLEKVRGENEMPVQSA